MSASLELPYSIETTNPVPVVKSLGPYATLADARAGVDVSVRHDGLTVKIIGDGEYWWLQADLSDAGLVQKTGASALGVDQYAVSAVIRAHVVQAVYNTSNEYDITTAGGPVGSGPGMRFSFKNSNYEYMPGDAGTLVWVRNRKGGSAAAPATGGSNATLYNATGQNTDGSMTQKSVTDALATKANLATDNELKGDQILTALTKRIGGPNTGFSVLGYDGLVIDDRQDTGNYCTVYATGFGLQVPDHQAYFFMENGKAVFYSGSAVSLSGVRVELDPDNDTVHLVASHVKGPAPVDADDLTTKQYVDSEIATAVGTPAGTARLQGGNTFDGTQFFSGPGASTTLTGDALFVTADNNAANTIITPGRIAFANNGSTQGSITATTVALVLAGAHVQVSANPTQPDDVVNKRTLDAAINSIGTAAPYTLPVATAVVLGGVKQGGTVSIDADGTLNIALPFPSAALKAAVSGGTFTSGELQGAQPSGSSPHMKFVDANWKYDYMLGMADTNGTAYVWVRTVKS